MLIKLILALLSCLMFCSGARAQYSPGPLVIPQGTPGNWDLLYWDSTIGLSGQWKRLPRPVASNQALIWDGAQLTYGNAGAPVNARYIVAALDGTLTNEEVLTGTSNQVIVTFGGAGGNCVLSTPQNIGTGSSPTFAGLTLSSPLTVGNGGTGSTTASGARSNLSAAASGANSDITSLVSGLITFGSAGIKIPGATSGSVTITTTAAGGSDRALTLPNLSGHGSIAVVNGNGTGALHWCDALSAGSVGTTAVGTASQVWISNGASAPSSVYGFTGATKSIANGTTNITTTDNPTFLIDATSGNVTINEIAASNKFCHRYIRVDNSANSVTVNRAGSDTITDCVANTAGNTSFTMAAYTSCAVQGGGGSVLFRYP